MKIFSCHNHLFQTFTFFETRIIFDMESVPKTVETPDEKKERIENSDLLQTRLDFYREQQDALGVIYSSKKINNPVIQEKAAATEKKLTEITLSPDESMQTPDRVKAKERIAAKKAEIKDILDRYLTVESHLNHINQEKEKAKKPAALHKIYLNS